MCQTDEEYVLRSLGGDAEAFRRLVQRHQKALRAYLVGRLGNRDLAEEAAQEAFVRAWFSLSKLRSARAFLPWLIGIASRAAKEQARPGQKVRAAGDLLDAPAPAEPQAGSGDESLTRAVARLPEEYREAVLLRYHAGMSCSEMAEHLGIPVGSVTKRLSRAYGLLREMLAGSQVVRKDGEVIS